MAQGATQFCRKDVFFDLGGYDESLYMGDDVDFYWRLKRFAKRRNGRGRVIEDERVVPSTRRFDQDPIWRNLLWTNRCSFLFFDGKSRPGLGGTEKCRGEDSRKQSYNPEPNLFKRLSPA